VSLAAGAYCKQASAGPQAGAVCRISIAENYGWTQSDDTHMVLQMVYTEIQGGRS